jgi:hypothetical protein
MFSPKDKIAVIRLRFFLPLENAESLIVEDDNHARLDQ